MLQVDFSTYKLLQFQNKTFYKQTPIMQLLHEL